VNLSIDNYIYKGTIRHRRFTPFNHFFNYPIFMVFFDIAKVETMIKKSWLWNINKPSLISFYRKDYHGNQNESLDAAVRATVFKKTGQDLKGPIRILTNLRYFGYCFNPVSFYYCFDQADQEVELIMAEVTNTPWKERHSYIISDKLSKEKSLTAILDKEFHVSPFWGMDHDYEWVFSQPEEGLVVNMKNFKQKDKVFDVTLIMNRKTLNEKNLIKQMLRFPFLTLRVVFRIHWQAVKLWIKNAPFFSHPDKIRAEN
jgi:DUF1365 family protein